MSGEILLLIIIGIIIWYLFAPRFERDYLMIRFNVKDGKIVEPISIKEYCNSFQIDFLKTKEEYYSDIKNGKYIKYEYLVFQYGSTPNLNAIKNSYKDFCKRREKEMEEYKRKKERREKLEEDLLKKIKEEQ